MNKDAIEDFLSLPLNPSESWQAGMISRADPFGSRDEDDECEMNVVLCRSVSTGLIAAKPFLMPRAARLEGLVEVMLELAQKYQVPSRPARIECNDRDLVDQLNELLGRSKTATQFVAKMAKWDKLRDDLMGQLDLLGPSVDSLLETGCTELQIREFAEAAASYYRASLWDILDDIDLIKIESPPPPMFLRYAAVLGAASQAYGLGFCDDAEDHYDITARRATPSDRSLSSVIFDRPANSPAVDVQLWEELNLPLATEEALPSMILCSDLIRRPTPTELEFTTVVLKALGATSEKEIDSGRWEKSVECFGKVTKCVLSIPNLLDPPDRQEWIRRGIMPESRSFERHLKRVREFVAEHADESSPEAIHEAIVAGFTGTMDDASFPMDTPADRANALCQQAVETFGRRRIQLARQALAEDPTHLEASVLLAESIRSADQRIATFQAAKEKGKAQLGTLLEQAGHFWGLVETRPYLRACQGLAEALQQAGRIPEAIEQYQEILHLNPDDNLGIRYLFASLLITHNRLDEVIQLLEQYPEETARWHYFKAVAEFCRSDRSVASRTAIRAAFGANEYVAELLKSDVRPELEESYSAGSPEEAAICIHEMADAFSIKDEFVGWMLQEYAIWDGERVKKLRDRYRKQRKKGGKRKKRR